MTDAPFAYTFAAALALATLVGCTDAGKCERGEPDCACTDDSSCAQGSCVAGTCVGLGFQDVDIRDNPIECVGRDLDNACAAFCEAFCDNQDRLCVSSGCEPGDCDEGGAVLEQCFANCSDGSCAESLCLAETSRSCEDFSFLDDDDINKPGCFRQDPKCVVAPSDGCSDSCGSISGTGGDLTDNGVCEDGADDSDKDTCRRGTDCTDCGARACESIGGSCGDNSDCCAYFSGGAACVELSDGPTCLEVCTDTRTCDGAFKCSETMEDGEFVCAPN